jgi:hypothetical protein
MAKVSIRAVEPKTDARVTSSVRLVIGTRTLSTRNDRLRHATAVVRSPPQPTSAAAWGEIDSTNAIGVACAQARTRPPHGGQFRHRVNNTQNETTGDAALTIRPAFSTLRANSAFSDRKP